MKTSVATKGSIIGAILAAVAASLCCVGPLVLLLLGVGGTWVSYLTTFESIRPLSIIVTVVFLSIAFWKLHIKPVACKTGKPCTTSQALNWQRFIFWIITVGLLALIAFPWYAHLFYR